MQERKLCHANIDVGDRSTRRLLLTPIFLVVATSVAIE